MIKTARFITSVASPSQMLASSLPEIAVCGKSNSGKSSFINMLTGYSRLAKTAKTPGKTRLINYFDCNNGQFLLVDLPGYGYAKVSAVQKQAWSKLIEYYLEKSVSLKHVFLLLDIRRNPSADDIGMVNYLYHYSIPFTIVATKADKISRAQRAIRKREIATAFRVGADNIFTTSNVDKMGKEEILQKIQHILQS